MVGGSGRGCTTDCTTWLLAWLLAGDWLANSTPSAWPCWLLAALARCLPAPALLVHGYWLAL